MTRQCKKTLQLDPITGSFNQERNWHFAQMENVGWARIKPMDGCQPFSDSTMVRNG